MKIKQAEITGFGKYHEQTFRFEENNQLFFGANEVGKSTLYQFFVAMLFGFAKKTKKKDYTPQNGAAYGGKLWLEFPFHGEVVIERYRQVNRGRAKVWVNGQIGDEALLENLLHPLNQELFQDVFTFQQEQLSQLDKLQEEELHQALIALGISGSQKMLAQAQRYLNENQQLFKPRGQKLPLNQALKRWEKLKGLINEKEAEETQLQQYFQQIAMLKVQQQQTETDLESAAKEYQMLQQQISHWHLYEEWQQLKGQQAQLASSEDRQQLQQFYQRYQQITEEIRQKEDELSRLEQGQESDKYFFFLDQEHQINQILQQQIELIRLEDALDELTQRKQQLIQQLNELVQQWQWSKDNPPVLTEDLAEQVEALEKIGIVYDQALERQAHLLEKQVQLETEVTQLEKTHPFLIQKQTSISSPILLVVVGSILTGSSFLFAGGLRWLLLAVGILGLASAGFLWQKQGQHRQESARRQWQEKLLQLDLLAEEVASVEATIQTQQTQYERLYQRVQPFFHEVEMHEWRAYLANYQMAVADYQEGHIALQRIQEQIAQRIHKQQEYQALFEPFADWLPMHQHTLGENLQILQQFQEEMTEIKMTRLQQPSTLLAQQLKQKKTEREALLTENQAVMQSLQINHPAEISLWLKQWEQEHKKQQREAELAQILTPLFPKTVTQAELMEAKFELDSRQQALRQALRQTSEHQQRLELEVAQQQKQGTLNQLYQEESDLRATIHEMAVVWAGNQLSAAFLQDLTATLSEQQLPHLLQQASHYFRLLSENRYHELTIEDGILVVKNQTTVFSIYALSTGTKDQLIMAIRFGYLSLQHQQPLSPIIIDDGWLHYDSGRKKQLAKLLAEFGKEYQVICLSSDQEMVSYYQEYQQPVKEIREGK